ncbi:MAG: hypothetical protein R3E01_22790 [Pirellulaceae bacterium]|nr:hypothetical protein [Planctomycetales bacterium]
MKSSWRKPMTVTEAAVAITVGLAVAWLTSLALVPVVLLVPFLLLGAIAQSLEILGDYPLDVRRAYSYSGYLWYALGVAVALLFMDSTHATNVPTGNGVTRLLPRFYRGATIWTRALLWVVLLLIVVNFAQPIVESYRLTPFARAGADLAYEYPESDTSHDRVVRIDFSGSGLNDGQLLELKPALDHNERFRLNLNGTSITDAGLDAIVGNDKLIELRLRGTQITDWGIAKLAGCPALQRLDLSRTAITAQAIETLVVFDRLQRLDLSETAIGDAGVLQLQRLDNLAELTLTRFEYSDGVLEELRQSNPAAELFLISRENATDGVRRAKEHTPIWQLVLGGAIVMVLGLGPFYLGYRAVVSRWQTGR